MTYFTTKAVRWVAPLAMVGALGLAACGDKDGSQIVTSAAPESAGSAESAFGSDQHLRNQAAEIARRTRANAASSARLSGQAEQFQRSAALRAERLERDAKLEASANTYAKAASVVVGSDQHLLNLAEEIGSSTRSVGSDQHLSNLAEEIGASATDVSDYPFSVGYTWSSDDQSSDEFVPGSRHMPVK